MESKEYVVTLKYNCYWCECGQIINDEIGLDELGSHIDVEQMEGNVSKDTTEFLLTCGDSPEITVTDKETGKAIETVKDSNGDDCPIGDFYEYEDVGENWIEKKLKLKPGNRYYLQVFTSSDGETFKKKVSFKIKTEGDFDINKLLLVYDTTFDKLFWNIYREEEEGKIVGDIDDDFDGGLENPYMLYYDGKIVKANKFKIGRVLRGNSYITFKWK